MVPAPQGSRCFAVFVSTMTTLGLDAAPCSPQPRSYFHFSSGICRRAEHLDWRRRFQVIRCTGRYAPARGTSGRYRQRGR